MTTMGHNDPASIYWPLALQLKLYFVLQHPWAVFLLNQTHNQFYFPLETHVLHPFSNLYLYFY